MKSSRRDLYRYVLIFPAYKYWISGMGDVITRVNEQSVLTKQFCFKIMQCALIQEIVEYSGHASK